MVGSLAGRNRIGMAGLKLEIPSAVLQHESTALGDDARAETMEVGVDEGDAVALLVGNGKIHRVAMVMGRTAMVVNLVAGLRGVEQFGSLREILLRDELCGRNLGDVRVCDPPACIGEGNPKGFYDGVEIFRGVVLVFREGGDLATLFKLFEYSEGHEGYDPLAVWRVLPDLHASVIFITALSRDPVDVLCLILAVALSFEDSRNGGYWLAA